MSKSFPAWTVTRDFWEQALKPEISGIAVDIRLFHESGKRLIHKYRVYQDPLPHPALRGGRITRLLSFVNQAMVITQLTHLRIAIPSSGNPPGEVPSDCFPKMAEPGVTKTPKWVTFASMIQTTTGEMDAPMRDQEETLTDNPMITMREETVELKAQETEEESIVPPPSFRPFQWPQADWEDIGDTMLDPGLEFVASWSSREERSSPPPLIPLLCGPSMDTNRSLSESNGNKDRDKVPRWRLAREGPFTNEQSQASLRVLGKGCAFRHTTYSVEDHAPPEGGLGVPLNHPASWSGLALQNRPGFWK